MGQMFMVFLPLFDPSCFIIVSNHIFKDSMPKMFYFLPSRWFLNSTFLAIDLMIKFLGVFNKSYFAGSGNFS